MAWIGESFERASSAADPAVEPTSMAAARRASLALFEPADLTQFTVTPWSASSASSQPWFLMIRLSGLYVAKSMLSVPPVVVIAPFAAPRRGRAAGGRRRDARATGEEGQRGDGRDEPGRGPAGAPDCHGASHRS